MPEKVATVDIDHDLIVDLMKLPYGTEILSISATDEPRVFRFTVTSPELSVVPNGDEPPQVSIELEKISTRYVYA